MLYIVLFCTQIACASISSITTDLSSDTPQCEYTTMHGSDHRVYPPGVTCSDAHQEAISTQQLSLPYTRLAAFTFRNHQCPARFWEHSTRPEHWPYFDYTKKQTGSDPVHLLSLVYHKSPCHPINSYAIWLESITGTPSFTLMEKLLTDANLDSTTKKLLTQLYTVESLTLAALSETMYTELSALFSTILVALKERSCLSPSQLESLTLPKKTRFVDAMHGPLLPWQSIGAFSHYTRWLIEYRKNLDLNTTFNAEIHTIITKQINSFLSPEWHFTRPWSDLQEDWRTALWIPDEYIKEFLAYAQTQSSTDCKFEQIVDIYEKAAIEVLNAQRCCSLYRLSLPAMKNAFHEVHFTHSNWRHKAAIWSAAEGMTSFNIPVSFKQLAPYHLLSPQDTYYAYNPPAPLSYTPHFPAPPQAAHFLPGSTHFMRAKVWHDKLSAGYEKMTSITSQTLPVKEYTAQDLSS